MTNKLFNFSMSKNIVSYLICSMIHNVSNIFDQIKFRLDKKLKFIYGKLLKYLYLTEL